jgi:hypothetical protein
VGWNEGVVYSCYSISDVQGQGAGLVSDNWGIVSNCYSTGAVSHGAGLVGENSGGVVTGCFWDIETSGQTTSAGGTGKTTAEMQMGATFLEAAWDFVDETANGTEDTWWILEGKAYPRLSWEDRLGCWTFSPDPRNGALDVIQSPTLRWFPARSYVAHDLYFGKDLDLVANGTTESPGVYRGRQAAEATTYEPGTLEWGKTYFWRVDEVNEADPGRPWKGDVWRFTTTHSVISPYPPDGTTDVIHSPILSWVPVASGLQYDVYLGEDEKAVANATPESLGIYQARQPSEITTYDPCMLKSSVTYYWRIDGVDEADPNRPWKGDVWRFATVEFLSVVDDFESYGDNYQAGQVLLQTWISGLVDQRTGSVAGPFGERTTIHGGKQSMPFWYDNTGIRGKPCYSEAQRTWGTPQDWTVDGADTLTL